MVLECDLKVFLSGITDKIKKDGEFRQLTKNELQRDDDDHGSVERNKSGNAVVDEKWICRSGRSNVNIYEEQCKVEIGKDDEDRISEGPVDRKRKRPSYLGMLRWISNVAKNPCNLAIGYLPERQKWKHYGGVHPWKKILLVREAMLLERNMDERSQQAIWQKKRKMHPSMYNYQSVSERLRCSRRLVIAKDSFTKTQEQICVESSSSGFGTEEDVSDKQSDSSEDSVCFGGNYIHRKRKRVPVGPLFQANVPKYPELDYKGNPKWLGTKIWPLINSEGNRTLIEKDPIGKGRHESCGCLLPGSLECVKFHVGQKRMKLKLELGLAFYWWKFYCMGEEVAFSWTAKEENKFQDIVKSNRVSSEEYFWDELFRCFPSKGREALVSYYFNVFHLRLRGQQNRNTTSNIQSDDEESEFGPICNRFGHIAAESPGSIFCSPKKTQMSR